MPARTPAVPRTPRRRARPIAAGALALAALVAVRMFVVEPVGVQGTSMEPTVDAGDTALVSLLARTGSGLRRGELVVFRDPDGALALKRVVGLAGDRVAILDAVLQVNGHPVREPYLDLDSVDGLYVERVTVPAGHVFVLGDNRAFSVDSRSYGPVADERIVGSVVAHW